MADNEGGIKPYLTVQDGAAAVKFYVAAFGATEIAHQLADDGKRYLHAHLRLNGDDLFLSDDFPEFRGGKSMTPHALGGSPLTLHLDVPDVDAFVARAVAAGAKITMPVDDMFWGARYGKIEDPFGHAWSIASPSKTS